MTEPQFRTGAGRAGLAAVRADLAGALVALDYDGTLSPIVADVVVDGPAGVVALLGSLL